ncbi:hypothetical protein [Azorhizobium doebereinerae]|uniref:hypothetical protein n=1 Tax=Azorhizobium doebereinerae TaxID=281091 RepID=UPI000416A706|nr:hypothetical protein [Azorhizobium doebereinerae]
MSGSLTIRLPEWVGTVALPIATALMGLSFPLLISLSHDLGRLEEKISSANEKWTEKFDTFSKQSDAAAEKLDTVLREVRRLNERFAERDSDPIQLLSKLGVKAQGNIVSAIIDGRVYLFPKDAAANSLLAASGFALRQISPAVIGFEVPKVTP